MQNKQATTGVRTFGLVASVSGFLEGEKLDDYPANIQDRVLAALEVKAQEVQLPLTIVGVRCVRDEDLPDDHPHRFYLHIIASEIVAADERTLLPGSVVQ